MVPTNGAADKSADDSVDQVFYGGLTNVDALNYLENGANETRTAEDGGQDMFVDCPDEIENSEAEQKSEEKENLQDNGFQESVINVQHLMTEMELLRDMFEKSIAEKDEITRNCEKERKAFMRELNHALDERDRNEEKVKEIHSVLLTKNQEIDFLKAKVSELSQSSNFMQSQLHEAEPEKDMNIEETVNRILSFLSTTLQQEELLEGAIAEKISSVEKSVTFLVQKHNFFLSEMDQLRSCLTAVGSNNSMMDEVETFVVAHDKILELRRNEENLFQNVRYLEDENRILHEQLEKYKLIAEKASTEIEKLSSRLEEEKNRYANTKEKLIMAVTKGKALVQQRDSLKLSLAEKTSDLEKCMIELQEKSGVLEAAASLQESLEERDMILQKFGEVLWEGVAMNEFQSTDLSEKLRWLVVENKSLKASSLQYHKLTNALSVFTFPETVVSSELDARVHWLAESHHLSKEEALKLKYEIAETRAAANEEIYCLTTLFVAEMQEKSYLQAVFEDYKNKYEALEKSQNELAEARETANHSIDYLNASLLAESNEKNYLQVELEDLRNKYELIVQREYCLSLEMNQIVSMLLEASGLTNVGHQEDLIEQSDMRTTIVDCLAKIKEKEHHLKSLQIEARMFERFQSLLYIREQETRLYELIVEEYVLDGLEVNRLSNELQTITQELNALQDEKSVIQKSHEQLEEKCSILREKLSMAVKKGKGLFQERENLKAALTEKNTETDRLKSELELNLSAYNDCQDQITKLSLDMNRISQLEIDLVATQERAEQLEKFLAESNNMLKNIMESIEGITTPADLTFEGPAEKVKWFIGYLNEREIAEVEMEQELIKVKDGASSLAGKFFESQTMTESLEVALTMARNNISQLLDEKKEFAASKTLLEEELQKTKEEASSQTTRFEEVSMSRRALEDALSLAENNISQLMNNRDTAVERSTLAEERLQKMEEEVSVHISKLADADKTIQGLETAFSESQKNIFLLTEENSKLKFDRAGLDNEVKKVKEEAESQASKLADTTTTIKSLQDALIYAENDMADLVQENKNAEKEILALDSKLKSCMEELAGMHGGKESLPLELLDQLSNLQLLQKVEVLSNLLEQCFTKNIENLKDMEILLKEMRDIFREMDPEVLQGGCLIMEDTYPISTAPSSPDSDLNMSKLLNDEINAADGENIMYLIEKMIERFSLKDKILADKVKYFSSSMDESVAVLLNGLHITKGGIISSTKYIKSLKQQMKEMEADKERKEDTIASLESDIRNLSSSCTDAIQELDFNVQKNLSNLISIFRVVKFDDKMSIDLIKFGGDASEGIVSNHMKTAEMLLQASRHSQDLGKLFLDVINKLTSVTEDMQKNLQKSKLSCNEVMEERDLYRDKIYMLETDIEALQNSCDEMKLKLDDYKEKEDNLRKRETEFSTSLSKYQEFEDCPLSGSQIKSILHKMNGIVVPNVSFEFGNKEPDGSADVTKLFYVIDSFNGPMKQESSLLSENEELQSNIEKHILEIEFMKNKIEDYINNEKVVEEKMGELVEEIESGLHDMIRKLGGDDLMDNKVAGARWLLCMLDKLVMASSLESKNLKSKNEELSATLLGAQRVVDDLSNKLKFFEDSNHARFTTPEMDQERGTPVAASATQSEISEVQEMGAPGTSNTIPLVPSAAHARTTRKGSSDHLAINIDTESEQLITSNESDEDKGHIFKSLNTSGLIPRQGRTAADRIDGFWVSGSRALMSHPRGRLGLIAYCLFLHVWLLGTIL